MKDVALARVVFNRAETPHVSRLGLAWDATSRGVRPARFCMLAMSDRRLHLLPRPFSVSDVSEHEGQVVTEFLYKAIGRVTSLMMGLLPGDSVFVFGPCGNGFPEPEPDRTPILLAGGIGNAPFALQVRELLARGFGSNPERIHLFLAGRSAHDVWIQPWIRDAGITLVLVTEDGSLGHRGRITDALSAWMSRLPRPEAFACGPAPMLRALQAMAVDLGFPCHLAVEEHMACGWGVCNACAVEQRTPGTPRGQGRYLRACVDGPVFEAREIWT